MTNDVSVTVQGTHVLQQHSGNCSVLVCGLAINVVLLHEVEAGNTFYKGQNLRAVLLCPSCINLTGKTRYSVLNTEKI